MYGFHGLLGNDAMGMQCSACGPLQYGVNCESILLVMDLIERGNSRLLYKYYSYKDTFIEQTSNTIIEHEECRVGHFEQTDKPDQTSPYPPQESRKLSICLVCTVTNPHGTSAFLAMPTVPVIHYRHRRRISSLKTWTFEIPRLAKARSDVLILCHPVVPCRCR